MGMGNRPLGVRIWGPLASRPHWPIRNQWKSSFSIKSDLGIVWRGESECGVLSPRNLIGRPGTNGNQILITVENFKEYSFHYRQYRLNEFHRQTDYIRQGLHSVVSSYFLNLFTASQLEEAVWGRGRIDVELLKPNTIYEHDLNQSSSAIERFWKVMSEMFTEEQKKVLLVFAWGRSTLLIRDEDFTSKFTICKYDVESGNVDQALPRKSSLT